MTVKTFAWYYLQAGFAVLLLVLSNEVSNPTKYSLTEIALAYVGFFGVLMGALLIILLATEDRYKTRERLGKFGKFLYLTLGWLIGLFNQATGAIIPNLAPLAGIPVIVLQGVVIVIILLLLGIVAGGLWMFDLSKVMLTERRISTILDYNPNPTLGKRFRGFLKRLAKRKD